MVYHTTNIWNFPPRRPSTVAAERENTCTNYRDREGYLQYYYATAVLLQYCSIIGLSWSGTSWLMKVLYSSSGDVWKVSFRLKLQVEMRTPVGQEAGLEEHLGAGLEEHLGAGLLCRRIQRSKRSRSTPDSPVDLDVYLRFAGLGLLLLSLSRRLRLAGGGKNHPLTELCEVRGHSGYSRGHH